MIALKQPITKETFIFEIFFHISLARSFSYSLFFNTTSLFIGLKVQNILYFKVSSKHARNNCVTLQSNPKGKIHIFWILVSKGAGQLISC